MKYLILIAVLFLAGCDDMIKHTECKLGEKAGLELYCISGNVFQKTNDGLAPLNRKTDGLFFDSETQITCFCQ